MISRQKQKAVTWGRLSPPRICLRGNSQSGTHPNPKSSTNYGLRAKTPASPVGRYLLDNNGGNWLRELDLVEKVLVGSFGKASNRAFPPTAVRVPMFSSLDTVHILGGIQTFELSSLI